MSDLPDDYQFPTHRLLRTQRHPDRQPVVLVACGSFSPVTFLHLRMFEMAVDYARQNTNFEIVGGYLSPVSDMYKKQGLLCALHRINMCTIATEQTSNWLMVDPWEALQSYQRTAVVLDHFHHEINTIRGGVTVEGPDGESISRQVKIMLLAGSDLISTMSEPGVWSPSDLDHILGKYGCFTIERAGSDMTQSVDALSKWRENIHLISQLVQNDVSSTKVRLFLRRGLSVRYLLPSGVIDYIQANGLYLEEAPLGGQGGQGQGQATGSSQGQAQAGPSQSSLYGGKEKEKGKEKDVRDQEKDGQSKEDCSKRRV